MKELRVTVWQKARSISIIIQCLTSTYYVVIGSKCHWHSLQVPSMKSVCALVLAVLSCYTATCNGSRPTPALTRHLGGSSSSSSPAHNRTAVILDHDGGVEDLIAMMLLLLEPRTKLLMVSYIEAGRPLQVLHGQLWCVCVGLQVMHRAHDRG